MEASILTLIVLVSITIHIIRRVRRMSRIFLKKFWRAQFLSRLKTVGFLVQNS
jgi:hypothetical protein